MEKLQNLETILSGLCKEGLTVAFSGGVDSCLLLAAACRTGFPVQAVMIRSQLTPLEDREAAEQAARECGAALTMLDLDVSRFPEIMENGPKRCYFCKRRMFEAIQSWSAERGIPHLADGTNGDDHHCYRPGLQALRELGVRSPLAECNMTKEDVRAAAAALGLSTARRPSAPCMATRLPYGAALDFSLLRKLEEGERVLKRMGFSPCRLRLHGDVARIEVPRERVPVLAERGDEVCAALRPLGFSYLTLDLEGFRSGSMDIGVKDDG